MLQTRRVTMVRGPATVRVRGGRCTVLAADVSDSVVNVRAGKALPFEHYETEKRKEEEDGSGPPGATITTTTATIIETDGERWEADPARAGTWMWRRAARRLLLLPPLLEGNRKVIMIVGRADAGKSTFATFLANSALAAGLVPCVVDGDIGQGDLAPPGAMGAALLRAPATDLRDVRADLYEFVGDITPSAAAAAAGGLERVVAEKLRLLVGRARRLDNVDICIVNTDGYVSFGGGARYKAMLASQLRPDAAVVIGRGVPAQLQAALARKSLVMRVRSGAHIKTYQERMARRLEQYMRHVGAGSVTCDLAALRVIAVGGGPAGQGGVERQGGEGGGKEAMAEGMFVGLGLAGRVVGFGIVEGITGNGDDRRGRMVVTIRTDTASFDAVYLSNILLKDGKEVRLFL